MTKPYKLTYHDKQFDLISKSRTQDFIQQEEKALSNQPPYIFKAMLDATQELPNTKIKTYNLNYIPRTHFLVLPKNC